MLDRFRGCMLGLAYGDAFGWPVEFMEISEIKSTYGDNGITELTKHPHFPLGTYTDDTQMSVEVADAILSADTNEDIIDRLCDNFVRWSESPNNNRAPGRTCMSSCRQLSRDRRWRSIGHNNSAGCGTAMRSAPIGLRWWSNEKRIIEVAAATSVITHGSHIAIAGGISTALLVAWAVRKNNPDTYLEHLLGIIKPISLEFFLALEKVEDALEHAKTTNTPLFEQSTYQALGEGWTAEEAVACALSCFLYSPQDFKQTIINAVNTSGDSDTIGCIAGAISGAFNGLEAVLEAGGSVIENYNGLQMLANQLYVKMHEP